MKDRTSLYLRVFIIAGLLLQLTGSLPLGGLSAARASDTPASFAQEGLPGAPAEQGDEPPPPLPIPAELPAPEPLPVEQVSAGPPEPLEPSGPYYANALFDGSNHFINTDVGGTIAADTTWTLAGSPYTVTSSLTVAEAATLTIEPGVTVTANLGVSFTIAGRLLAQGTSGARITFGGSSATPGHWGGLSFEGTFANPRSGSILDYVDLRDGGYYASRPGNLYAYYTELSLDHATVSNAKYNGVYGSTQGLVQISNTTLSNNGAASPETDYPIWFTDGDVAPDLASLTLSGNSQDVIAFGPGTLNTRTWRSLGYPYIFTGGQTVPAGETLTVEAGVEARFQQAVSLMVHGTLLAQGGPTAGAGISFAGTSATPGHWSGVYLEGSSGSPLTGSILDYVTITDGGYYGSRPANLYLYYATASLNHATLANSQFNGVYGGSRGVAHISNTTISNNGAGTAAVDYAIWFTDGSVAPELSSLTLSGNGQDAIAFGAGTLSTRTWRSLGYPYVFTGGQTVPVGATLTVEAGVQAFFQQPTSLSVYGRILAQGGSAATAGISFAGTSATPGWWGGVYLEGTNLNPLTGSILEYVTIRDGGYFISRPGNLYLYYAEASLDHATLTNSKYNGVYGGSGGVAHLHNTTLSDNGTSSPEKDFAAWFSDGSVAPELGNLTLSGNSIDGIAFGPGTLTSRTWRALGYPYYLTGTQSVPYGATLTVEPGVTVKADTNLLINIYGRLEAVGGPGAEITFTSSDPTPGAWMGLSFSGVVGKLATGLLDYTIIEYGGNCGTCANLKAYYSQVNIGHSHIRNSSKEGVQAGNNSAAGMVIHNSQFTGNAVYGVRNVDGTGFVLAANNWWGHASGPSTPTNACNATGSGQAVTDRVAFQPFLTSADMQSDDIKVSSVMTLSLNPLRYYAPADGSTKVWFEVTLRDGAGMPVSGQVVRLRSNLGLPRDGGSTDVAGKVFAYLTSTHTGDAVVYAELDEATACDFLRSATTDITFTDAADDPLSPDAQSPYSNNRVEFDPAPVVTGRPGMLRVHLTNPNAFPIRVNASFGYAQLGLGLIFGPVGAANDVLIPANSTGVLETPWTPLASGHFCIRVEYDWTQVGAGQRRACQRHAADGFLRLVAIEYRRPPRTAAARF